MLSTATSSRCFLIKLGTMLVNPADTSADSLTCSDLYPRSDYQEITDHGEKSDTLSTVDKA
jgi:hypothetical protein